MAAQAATMMDVRYTSATQISLNDGPLDRLRYCKETSGCQLRSSWPGPTSGFRNELRFATRKAQKAPCLLGNLTEIAKPKAFADDVEKIAMLAGCCVGLMFNCT